MGRTITYGRIAGVPLKVQLNWFLTAALVTWSLAGGYFPLMFPNHAEVTYWLYGVGSALVFFGSVLIHELGHAVISMREGVPVKSITLFIFGGMAHISREPSTPRSEFRIVAAGPLASLLMGVLLTGISLVTKQNAILSGAAFYLGQLNFILAVFNLIPGFPLDGGRLLRSLLWAITRDFHRATRWAVNVGLLLSGTAILGGIALFFIGYHYNGIWIFMLGLYLGNTARVSYSQSIKYAPWPEQSKRPSLSRIESIQMRSTRHTYRSAILRIETVNHRPVPMVPQPVLLPIEESNSTFGVWRDKA